jgi:hypothetical protein
MELSLIACYFGLGGWRKRLYIPPRLTDHENRHAVESARA